MNYFYHKQPSLSYRLLSAFVAFTFSISLIVPPVQAQQTILNLPFPGSMVSTTPVFSPTVIKGIKIFPNNPLRFDFIVDTGDSGLNVENDRDRSLQQESKKLIKYFLAALTTPEKDLWVNLSPYEKDRIIPEAFGQTEMGKDLLSQDYILKQLTASLMYPEKKLAKLFGIKYIKKLMNYMAQPKSLLILLIKFG